LSLVIGVLCERDLNASTTVLHSALAFVGSVKMGDDADAEWKPEVDEPTLRHCLATDRSIHGSPRLALARAR